MIHYEDDRPFVIPDNLKDLTHSELRERADKLIEEYKKNPENLSVITKTQVA
jgi:hypothetical protein